MLGSWSVGGYLPKEAVPHHVLWNVTIIATKPADVSSSSVTIASAIIAAKANSQTACSLEALLQESTK
jgi:hypothetical protein